jgi:starvation-inducible DNA-binding protein
MALAKELGELLGDQVVFYFRAHGYHWNVEGENFSQYHDLFADIYEDVYGSIDPTAENIRKLDEYAPFKLDTLMKLASIEDSKVPTNPRSMAKDLMQANEKVIAKIKSTFETAVKENEQAIANFLADRLDMHQKWAWQLKASTK